MHTVRIRIEKEQDGCTVKHIALKVAHLSAGSFRSLKFSGGVMLDGRQARADERVREGQELSFSFQEHGQQLQAEGEGRVSIAWEDEHYYVIDKQAPLPTMRSAHQTGETLEDALYIYLGKPENYLFRPVNRLDKGTSGLMVVAKNAYAQQRLQSMLHGERFIREYVAICDGTPENEEGTVDLPIGKMGEGIRRIVCSNGKEARTHFRVLQKGKKRSLIHLRLETGRTHQIRVHMAAVGCPVTGDYLYGEEHPALPGRFALHSCRIRFLHPMTGEWIEICYRIPDGWDALMEE